MNPRPKSCALCRRLLAALIAAVAGLVPGPAPAAVTPGEIRTTARLETTRQFTVPRVFVRGDNVRIYYTNDAGPIVFVGDWAPSHLQARGFHYYNAALKFDRTPPKVPKPDSSWREAVVLDRAARNTLAEAARRELAPAEPNTGTYFQSFLSEGIIYRDAGGSIRSVPFNQQPPEVTLVARYSTAEMALHLARIAEGRLRASHPGKDLFCLMQEPGGRGLAFVLLDFQHRKCVLLANPQTSDDPRGAPQLVATVRSLGSFAVESHGVALAKNPFSSAFRLAHISAQTFAGLLPTGRGVSDSPAPPLATNSPMDLVAWEAELDDLTDSELEPGEVQFLIDGERFFPVLESRISSATNSIHCEVCIFDTDDVAVDIADALKRRSAEVRVRVLYDLMASQGAALSAPATPMREGFVPPASIGNYLEAGSKIAARPFLNPWFSSDHSKVITFDGWVSYFGGMNLGREYRYEWHDLMAEVRGPILTRFESDFRRAWAHAGAGGDLAFAGAALAPTKPLSRGGRESWAPLRRLYTRPGETQIRKAVVKSLSRAQQRLWLENPYLYDPAVVKGLLTARGRGVDVRIVLPSDNDFGAGKSSNLVTANNLVRGGVRVFLYPGMTHVKALVADGWATFGSANFNKLSLRTNHEFNLATSDAGIVGSLARDLFEVDFAKSREITEPIEVSWTDELADTILTQF